MIEDVATALAMPTMQCPLTGKTFADKVLASVCVLATVVLLLTNDVVC